MLAISALACIILPVSFSSSISLPDNEAILLTANYDRDSITKVETIFTLEKEIKKAYPKVILINNLEDIEAKYPAVRQLHVLGYGLNDFDLEQTHLSIIYQPSDLPDGVTAANWPHKLKTGEPLRLQGSYRNQSSKDVKLVLKGLNTSLDSTEIAAGKSADFELTTTPKITGQAVYTLLAITGKDTVEKNPVPFTVEPNKRLKVLLLSSSPDFESKFLKDWLGQNGYEAALRTTISTNKISQDFMNMDKLSLDHLSASTLEKFDVVIGDLPAIQNLNASKTGGLKQQIEQNGLGLIVRSDSSAKPNTWPANVFRISNQSSKTAPSPLILSGKKQQTSPLTIDQAYIIPDDGFQKLITDKAGHPLASATANGEGKLLLTTLHTTYTWALSGNQRDYSSLWTLLLDKAAKRQSTASSVRVLNIAPTADEPVTLQLQSNAAPASALINNIKVPYRQQAIPFLWNMTYWPRTAGWQHTVIPGMANYDWYTYRENDWQGIKNLKKIADTKKYSDNRATITTPGKQTKIKAPVEVPKLFFYILLLAACTYLWAEQKMAV